MLAHRWTAAAAALLLAVSVAGCGDSPTGLPDDFDAAAVADAVDAALDAQRTASQPTANLRSAFATLTGLGLTYGRADGATTGPGTRLLPVPVASGRSVEIPADLQGKTFVFDVDDGAWVSDSTRTAAPDSGVRVVWYTTASNGTLVTPLEERGYVDLTDEDAGGDRSTIGIRMVATTDSGDVVLADLSESFEAAGDTVWSQLLVARGFYGAGGDSVAFDITSTASGNEDTGDQEFSFSVEISSPETEYTLDIDGAENGATGVAEQTVTAIALHQGVSTRLTLDLTEENDAQTGSGTVAYRGETVVQVTVEETGNFRYRNADGGDLPSSDALTIDNLVRTLYLTGVNNFFDLPLLFFPG